MGRFLPRQPVSGAGVSSGSGQGGESPESGYEQFVPWVRGRRTSDPSPGHMWPRHRGTGSVLWSWGAVPEHGGGAVSGGSPGS